MTRTGALLWKEWRDHRVTMAVFAAVVPLVSWPVQRYAFKFAEPEWTIAWTLPVCVGLAIAALAADLFATDLATDRMNSFVALPVPLRRHFTVRTAFLALAAVAFSVWTIGVNAAIVATWGKPGAVADLLACDVSAARGFALCAAATAAVVLFSALGVGGFRAVLGGLVLALVAGVATDFAGQALSPVEPYQTSATANRLVVTILAATAALGVAAWAGFAKSRGLSSMRRRGALWAAAILVVTLGAPAAGAGWKVWRGWTISPNDPGFSLMDTHVSPDGRFVAVVGASEGYAASRACRSWIVSVDDGRVFDWPRRNDYVAGWTADGLAWVGRYDVLMTQQDSAKPREYGTLVRPETGEVVDRVTDANVGARIVSGWRPESQWARWMRYDWQPARPSSKGVPPTYTWRLWVVDGNLERKIEARSACATPTVGVALIVTPDDKLALVDLAGGEPRVVADDATGLQFWLTGSPDGRKYTVNTSKGWVVLDGATWQRVAGPFPDANVYWCCATGTRSVVAVTDNKTGLFSRFVDVDAGREIAIDPSLGVAGGYGVVQPLDDGRFVARTGKDGIVLLGADGKLIRRLFPPEE